MQKQSSLLFLVVVVNVTAALGLNTSHIGRADLGRPNISDFRPVISNGYIISAIVSNDGPTIFGTRTAFKVTLRAPAGYYVSYQWGTFIPYRWMHARTYNYSVKLEVNWWETVGSKDVYFYIDGLKRGGKSWSRIAHNSSSVEVIDYLTIDVIVHQSGKQITDRKIKTGVTNLQAVIHDPSGFFKSTVTKFVWIFNDGTPSKVTTWNDIDHTFKSLGLFLVQISASLRKNGKLYKGDASFYLEVKAKLDGYILAWKEDDNHPTLPSREKSLPIGSVNLQFKLVDKYSSLAGAVFSYVWNYGDGTIVEGIANATHLYQTLGNMRIVLGVYAKIDGNTYHSLIYKNISIRAPIKDLDVKSHSKLKMGKTVQFNVTCSGSSPVSFCWYVTRGSCQLPSDVMCSPTRLYHHCRNTINHTFHHTGDYCVNVTVMNTVSFAEKSINIQVNGDDLPNGRRKTGSVAVAVLPIIAGLLLFMAVFLGIKYKIQHQQRLARKTEVATFDFRSSQYALQTRTIHCNPVHKFCPSFLEWRGLCPVEDDCELDHEMEERRMFFEEEPGSTTPKRKTSYYGSIHRILGQDQRKGGNLAIAEEDPSPLTSRKSLSKSV